MTTQHRRQRNRDKRQRKRERTLGLLERLGLLNDFKRFSASLAKALLRKAPRVHPRAWAGPSIPRPEARGLERDLNATLPAVVVEVAGQKVTADSVLQSGLPFLWLCTFLESDRFRHTLLDHDRRAKDAIKAVLNDEVVAEASTALAFELTCALLKYARIDGRYYLICTDLDADEIRNHGLFRIDTREAVAEMIRVDGVPRRCYRVGRADVGEDSFEWCDWRHDGAAHGEGLPVFVQGHALRQLEARMDMNEPQRVGLLHRLLADSVERAPLPARTPGEFLLPYNLGRSKMGYFAGIRLEDKVLLRTFLFLTMQGTPEAQALYEKLRLRRRDIEHLRLDRLSTFLSTDLKSDGELTEVLADCGCGHLFNSAELISLDEPAEGTAAAIRQYLRFDASHRRHAVRMLNAPQRGPDGLAV